MTAAARTGLNILHVLRAPVGGLFRHVVDLARGQSVRGHRVGLVADSMTGGSDAEAEQFIETYFGKFPGIKGYLDDTIRFCEKHGYVQTLFGRRRMIPEI